MSTWKIGLISDTHGLLRSQAKDILTDCDLILHAGDMDDEVTLTELQVIAPTTAVRGNMDFGAWAQQLKTVEQITLGKWSIVMVHNINDLPALNRDTDIVIFGHSHRFTHEERDGILFINPGSAGPPRFHLPITMAILTLDEKATLEKIVLDNKA